MKTKNNILRISVLIMFLILMSGNASAFSVEFGDTCAGLSTGWSHNCILKSDGNVDCYGHNQWGQSNDYTNGDAVGVSAGYGHTCILKADGNVDCYGHNSDGQSNDYTNGDAVGVSAGTSHTCILKSDGNVDCQGYNSDGQSANYNIGDAIGVSVGSHHTCILKSTGNVYCYGANTGGQSDDYILGDAVGVSTGSSHTCILKSNGNVDCYGFNNAGQSDDYNNGDAVGVSAGGIHTCILKSNGNVYCYGDNTEGQSIIYNGGDAVGVSAGGRGLTCILKSNGNVNCYGENKYFGQVADYNGGDGICLVQATAMFEKRPAVKHPIIEECQKITSPGIYSLSDNIENVPSSDLIIDNTNHGKSCIDIAASDVVLDCKGHKIDGLGGYSIGDIWKHIGVHIRGRHNVELKNCIITDWEYGAHVMNSNNIKIHDNTISNNDVIGLGLEDTGNSEINNNEINNNSMGAGGIVVGNGAGLALIYSGGGNSIHHNIIKYNAARGFYHSWSTDVDDVFVGDTLNNNIICESGDKDLYTYPNWQHITGDDNKCDTIYKDWNDTGTTGCTYDCSQIEQMVPDINIPGDAIKHTGAGNEITECREITSPGTYTLTSNITDATNLIDLSYMNYGGECCIDIKSPNVTLDCNGYKIDGTDASSTMGIHMYGVNTVIIKNCVITDWRAGITVMGSSIPSAPPSSVKIHNNDINSNTDIGVLISQASGNKVYNNDINSNDDVGISISSSLNDEVYNNEIKNNNIGVKITKSHGADIHNNIINSNQHQGVYNDYPYSAGDDNSLNSNTICYNGGGGGTNSGDLYSRGNTWNYIIGDNNQCEVPNGWNDQGTTGCTFSDCSLATAVAVSATKIPVGIIKKAKVPAPPPPPQPLPTTLTSGTLSVKECPNKCNCHSKAEAERKGQYLCNNEYIICDYIKTEALTAAAPNALGIPKYCFGEKIYTKCPDNCECMNRKDAYEKGYEFCGRVVRECADGLYCFQRPQVEICGKDTLIVTRRISPKSVSPPAYVDVYLIVKPIKTLNGIIITETIPNGMEPAWEYSFVSSDPDVEDKIKEIPVLTEIVSTIQSRWTPRKPDSWDPDTMEAKWVIRDQNGIKNQTFMYKLKAVGAASSSQIMYGFKGDWLISSGETCPIIGDEIAEIEPSTGWPPCPISDLELLKYIDMWSDGKLTDFQMLQLIKIWATAPPCPELSGHGTHTPITVAEFKPAPGWVASASAGVDEAPGMTTPFLTMVEAAEPPAIEKLSAGWDPDGKEWKAVSWGPDGKEWKVVAWDPLVKEWNVVGWDPEIMPAGWDPTDMPPDPLEAPTTLERIALAWDPGEKEWKVVEWDPGEKEWSVVGWDPNEMPAGWDPTDMPTGFSDLPGQEEVVGGDEPWE